ncbi:MAG TPA: nucleotide exchange factor GrpE [Chitinophagaceae bacterium]|nr:nucleotide exchange factor GrpE [Chitinophagaceae bacterium]
MPINSILFQMLRHFVPEFIVGRIVDNLTFAINFEKMRQKDMKETIEQAKKQEETATDVNMDINADENMSGSTHLNDPVSDASEVEKLKEELEDVKDKFLRKVAEFDNFRKRSTKEKIELIQTAGKDVITDLLVVLDDFSRAEKQMDNTQDIEHLKEGMMLIFTKFKTLLMAKGLKPMDAVNMDFDPEKHEAIAEIPAPTEEQKGKVIDEIEKGYYLNDKIIRYAKVIVGK